MQSLVRPSIAALPLVDYDMLKLLLGRQAPAVRDWPGEEFCTLSGWKPASPFPKPHP